MYLFWKAWVVVKQIWNKKWEYLSQKRSHVLLLKDVMVVTRYSIWYWKMTVFNVSKSNLKSTTPLWNQFYINFMIFFLNFWDLQPNSMLGNCLACLRSYPILAIFGPKRPSAASWAGLGCLKNNFPYYFNTTLAFGRCRQDCEKKVGPISLQWQSPWLLSIHLKTSSTHSWLLN